jgi:tetratricopeptide (TPR) repeat protein
MLNDTVNGSNGYMYVGRFVFTLSVLAVFVAFLSGCESGDVVIYFPPPDYVAMGWEAWVAGDYDEAEEYFGIALKRYGDSYMLPYNGLGWTYMRLQDPDMAANYFQDGILYGASYSDTDADKRALYVGLAYTLLAAEDFSGSIIAGETYLEMDPNGYWVHKYDARLTAYDAYIVLAVDYFAEGDADRCVDMVHYMQRMIGETPEYEFTTWSDLAAKIEDMVEKDPS